MSEIGERGLGAPGVPPPSPADFPVRTCERCGDAFEAPTGEDVWAYCAKCLAASFRGLM